MSTVNAEKKEKNHLVFLFLHKMKFIFKTYGLWLDFKRRKNQHLQQRKWFFVEKRNDYTIGLFGFYILTIYNFL